LPSQHKSFLHFRKNWQVTVLGSVLYRPQSTSATRKHTMPQSPIRKIKKIFIAVPQDPHSPLKRTSNPVVWRFVLYRFTDTSAPIFGAEVSRTLRHRCRSVFRHFGTKCLQTLRHRYRTVSRHFGKVRQANSRRIGLRRVHADPRVQDRVQLLRHITPVAQHSSVDITSGTTVAGRLAGVVAPGLWLRDARRSTRQPDRQQTSL